MQRSLNKSRENDVPGYAIQISLINPGKLRTGLCDSDIFDKSRKITDSARAAAQVCWLACWSGDFFLWRSGNACDGTNPATSSKTFRPMCHQHHQNQPLPPGLSAFITDLSTLYVVHSYFDRILPSPAVVDLLLISTSSGSQAQHSSEIILPHPQSGYTGNYGF